MKNELKSKLLTDLTTEEATAIKGGAYWNRGVVKGGGNGGGSSSDSP
jgi:hypothetical protein